MTDAELLAAIAEGRVDALRTLHERHAPWLVARLVVSSIGMDLVQVIPSEDSSLVAVQEEPFPPSAPDLAPFPGGRVALEAATVIAFALAAAAVVSRRGETEPGRIASGVLLGVYAATWMIPDPVKPWADPSAPRWDTGAPWWWVALGLFVLAGVGMSWDTRRRSWAPTKRDARAWQSKSITRTPSVSRKKSQN